MSTSTLRDVETVLTDVAQRGRAISAASGTWARDDRTPELARTLATLSNRQAAIAARCEERLPTIGWLDGSARSSADLDLDLDRDLDVFDDVGASTVDERLGALVRALTTMRDIAVDAAETIDWRLDEPTADALDDVRRRLDRDLAALAARSVVRIGLERQQSP
ncbi:MAG: hypothetical protein M3501_02270 [Actinomycetota bacterium]|nr:hypothetical protein [Actinomycetota bacterium]MDQ3350775.1 hypothetical protein [Actinomycetota bacterium]